MYKLITEDKHTGEVLANAKFTDIAEAICIWKVIAESVNSDNVSVTLVTI